MKNTKAATKALDSGIDGIYIKRINQGQICSDIMVLTNNNKALLGRIDLSLPSDKRIYGCKVVRETGKSAYQICRSYIE